MELDQESCDRIDRIIGTDSEVFVDLVAISGLSPKEDFLQANLRGADFSYSDMTQFDLEYADLRGVNWEGVVGEPNKFRYALQGRSMLSMQGKDFHVFAEKALKGRTWQERFFAFAIIVDTFGETAAVFELLEALLESDKSKYFCLCCPAYFGASIVRDDETLKYCLEFANGANSYANMYRFKKVKRLAHEIQRYLGSLERGKRFPGEVEINKVQAVIEGNLRSS